MMCSCEMMKIKRLNYCDISVYLDNPRFDIGGNAGRDQCSRDKRLQNSPRTRKLTIYISTRNQHA